MRIRSLKQIRNLKGKKILLRVDFNVPTGKKGKITDSARIEEALPTIKYLKSKKAKIIIISHLGRPDGQLKKELKLDKIAKKLAQFLKSPVKKLDEILGKKVEAKITKMKNGEIVMLENIRFDAGEEKCEKSFTKALASLGEIFVNDAFGTAHRKHASTAGLADFLPAYAGFLMEKEIKTLSKILNEKPKRPLTMIFGGAKIDTKIGIIKQFLKKADYFLIGGGLANTFLHAAGYNVGNSLYEKDKVEIAREIMLSSEKNKERFILPHDVIVSEEVSGNAKTLNLPIQDVMGNMRILDIGKWSIEKFNNIISKSKTIIWNGPVGLSEYKQFANGTRQIAQAIAKSKCYSIIGGGDTAEAIKRMKIKESKFTLVSTGGGACLEFLSGEKLPGIECLKIK
ncbi:phosphoglycerate kinase [Candidatus Peregrinibacteria bacterium]|nr:phosphoglycerate kinase [Candidatus Peregrinibacteria bacterium]